MKRSMDKVEIAQRRLQTTSAIKVNIPGRTEQFEFYIYGLKSICHIIKRYGEQYNQNEHLYDLYKRAIYK